MLKMILIAIWLVIAVNFFMPISAALYQPLKTLALLLVVIHLVEFFIFRKKIAEKGDSTLSSFVQTLLFGVVYIKG